MTVRSSCRTGNRARSFLDMISLPVERQLSIEAHLGELLELRILVVQKAGQGGKDRLLAVDARQLQRKGDSQLPGGINAVVGGRGGVARQGDERLGCFLALEIRRKAQRADRRRADLGVLVLEQG